jgi:gas vesicle protein
MKNLNREYDMQAAQVTNGAKHVLTGLIVGGVVGATAMLFLAPRSGEEMRSGVKDKALELRDRTTETVKDTLKDTLSQVKSKRDGLTDGFKGKAKGLKHKGQDMLVEKLDRVSEAVEAAREAIQDL